MPPKTNRLLLIGVLLALALAGCSCDDDRGGGSDDDNNNVNNAFNARPNNGDPNNGDPNNGDPNNGDPNNGDPNNGDPNNGDPNNGDPNNNLPPECEEGERECRNDFGYRVCSRGRWVDTACGEGELCRGTAECVLDPSLCRGEERICLDRTTPASCDPGVAWVAEDPCEQGSECVSGSCRSATCVNAANSNSYLGCDYLATDMPNLAYSFGSTPDAPMGVVLANPDTLSPVRFSVYEPDGSLSPMVAQIEIPPPVVAGQYAPVTVQTEIRDVDGMIVQEQFASADNLEIPAGGQAVLLFANQNGLEITNLDYKAHRIQTDQPVAAYQFGPYCCNYSFTNDASLLFPIPTLGTEYYYLGVPSWGQPDDGGGGGGTSAVMTIVGAHDNTAVTIDLANGAGIKAGNDPRIVKTGDQITATISTGEVLNVFSEGPLVRGPFDPIVGVDFSGSRISADRPIAVFSAHVCTFYPQDQGACDALEEQLFPTDTWGNDFSLVPPVLRAQNPDIATEAIFWKILAKDEATRIDLSAPYDSLEPRDPGFIGVPSCRDFLTDQMTMVMNAGDYCEFGTRAPLAISGSSPLMVMGIISGQDSTGAFQAFGAHAGDPAIYLVPPERQFRSRYTFLAPDTYFNDYLTIVTGPGAQITLDGELIDLADAASIPGSDNVYAHILISDGPHDVEGSQPFGILMFAFDDYVSYAFTGGLNLIKRAE